jgi:hypothetical protein
MFDTSCPTCGANLTVQLGTCDICCEACNSFYSVELAISWKLENEDGKDIFTEKASAYLKGIQNG